MRASTSRQFGFKTSSSCRSFIHSPHEALRAKLWLETAQCGPSFLIARMRASARASELRKLGASPRESFGVTNHYFPIYKGLSEHAFDHWETAVGWYSDANQGHLFCRGPPGLPAGIGILECQRMVALHFVTGNARLA
jgi:hypothetical protein